MVVFIQCFEFALYRANNVAVKQNRERFVASKYNQILRGQLTAIVLCCLLKTGLNGLVQAEVIGNSDAAKVFHHFEIRV